jgi:hypothetical protein
LLFTVTSTNESPPSKSGLKLVCNVSIAYGNLKSENSQDFAPKPQRNCTFMNSASGHILVAILLSYSQDMLQNMSVFLGHKIVQTAGKFCILWTDWDRHISKSLLGLCTLGG